MLTKIHDFKHLTPDVFCKIINEYLHDLIIIGIHNGLPSLQPGNQVPFTLDYFKYFMNEICRNSFRYFRIFDRGNVVTEMAIIPGTLNVCRLEIGSSAMLIYSVPTSNRRSRSHILLDEYGFISHIGSHNFFLVETNSGIMLKAQLYNRVNKIAITKIGFIPKSKSQLTISMDTLFSNLVFALEPFEFSSLFLSVPVGRWLRDPINAAVQALRISGKCNESAYLEKYPDVSNAGIDPLWHYVAHGIHEGRTMVQMKIT